MKSLRPHRYGNTVARGVFAALILAATLLTGGPAAAAPDNSNDTSAVEVDLAAVKPSTGSVPATFATQARTAGLTAGQTSTVQGKVDAYLAELGPQATQSDFNTIALPGADLHVTVPGEAHPRGLAASYCASKYFCAYSGEWQTGEEIHMYDCGREHYIPWSSTGSWVNNQTPGRRPVLTFTNGDKWIMPPAYADQLTGVNWTPVSNIVPC